MKAIRVLCAAVSMSLAIAASAAAATEGWLDDYDAALAQAKAGKKLIFMLFTASDVSANCKKLSKEVLETKDFKDYAAKNLVLLEVDFPQKKEQSKQLKERNRDLNTRLGGRTYPVIVLLDGDGKEQTRFSGYGGGGSKDMIAKLELFRK
jgi:protein disulfide-isomerase